MSRAAAVPAALGRHRVFAVVFALGVAIRVVTMLGFPPAIWFGGDSASYLSTGLRLAPGTSRLSGYGVMLALLRPFHSFFAVTAVQHLMGLAVAVMIYALLRRYRLPGWAATLATLPVLFDAYVLQLEHEILPSAPFSFLIMTAITLILWWRDSRPLWATAAAAAILAVAATLWPVGGPILILFLLYLIVRRAGWRAFTAALAAGLAPLALYLLWFNHVYGRLAFSNSDGIYLWSRTMSFANCTVIKPPADEAGLCPHQPLAQRPAASSFIWEPNSPLGNIPGPKFSVRKNALALNFAERAIAAQPLGYATSVLHDFSLTFSWDNPDHPSKAMTHRYEFAYATRHWISPDFVVAHRHTVASDELAYGGVTSTTAVQPFAGFLVAYQRWVYLRGTLLAVGLLIGLGGIVRAWRDGGWRRLAGWGGPGLYPWVSALALLLVPVMTADFSERYVVIAVPLLCLVTALAFAPREPARSSAAAAGAATGRAEVAGAATRAGVPQDGSAQAGPSQAGPSQAGSAQAG